MTNETDGPRNTAAIHNSKTHEPTTEETSVKMAALMAALQSMSIRNHHDGVLDSTLSEKMGAISVDSLEIHYSELGQTSFDNTLAIAWS
jgi:hypothetical protein